MSDLENARKIISETDREIAGLFCKLMKAVATVAAYKREHGLPIFDAAREVELLEKNAMLVSSDELRPYYVSFLQSTMDISKQYQNRLNGGMRVAYSGVAGSFAYLAATKIFEAGETVGYPDFRSAYRSVENGECECVILPLENSYNGDVGQVMDLAFFGPLYVNGIYDLSVCQHLLAKKGTVLSDIHEVISHPQALGQCSGYLHRNGFKTTPCENTALAAQIVAESDRRDIAAVASELAAENFGLNLLERNINDDTSNTTKFAVFTRALKGCHEDDHNFLMFFTVRNESGSLGKALSVIGENGFNLRGLKSRPTKELVWDYYFYAEGEGNIFSEKGKKMLQELHSVCSQIKVVGSYPKENLVGR